jgi:hypothetical protein
MEGPFFGVKSKMIVHDLNKIKPECNTLEVKITNRAYFTPDTLEETKKQGYDKCKICLGK